MTISLIPMTSLPRTDRISRRRFVAGALAALAVAGPGLRPAMAADPRAAQALVSALVEEVNTAINSGKGEPAMLADFARIFDRYCDVPIMARSALGPAARSASPAQLAAFTDAFRTYVARKYGRRFREFIGGRIEVVDARPQKSFVEVVTVAQLRGRSPLDMRWHVSDRSGRLAFFNIIIEGVNILAAERTEIGAMLDRRRGDVAALTADLRAL